MLKLSSICCVSVTELSCNLLLFAFPIFVLFVFGLKGCGRSVQSENFMSIISIGEAGVNPG